MEKKLVQNLLYKELSYAVHGAALVTIGLILVLFSGLPSIARAATTIYFDLENPEIYEGDIFLVDLKISTPDKSINVVDGTILYDSSKLEIKDVSAGNSLFALWPQPPIFSNEKGNLSFVGGAPNGFQGENGEVLKIIFLAKNEGEARLDFLDSFSVFLNDGQGTRLNPWIMPLSVIISKRPPETPAKDEWQILLGEDTTPPEIFEINLANDPNIFNNQSFISFFTTDKESGIDHYEIQEGSGEFIIGDSPYLLRDQKLRGPIRVKAIDKTGNERVVELVPTYPRYFYQTVWFWVVFIIVIISLIFIKNIIKKKNV